MKIISISCIFFVSLLSQSSSFNPDSEPVQGSSSDSDDASDKSKEPQLAQVRSENLQVPPMITRVSAVRPYAEWRNMGSPDYRYSRIYGFRERNPQRPGYDRGSVQGGPNTAPNSASGLTSSVSANEKDPERSTPDADGSQKAPMFPTRPENSEISENYRPNRNRASYPQRGNNNFWGPNMGRPNNRNRKPASESNMIASMINDFSFKLSEAMNMESNFVISPLSIFTALSMVYLGSDGRTKSQIESALGMDENEVHGNVFHQLMKGLHSLISQSSSEYQLFSANGIFTGKNFTVNPEFQRALQNFYQTQAMSLDFNNPEESMKIVNEWVAQKTQNTIPNVLSTPPHPLMRMILANAVYFKGTWKIQFPIEKTTVSKFTGSKRLDTMVDMMSLTQEDFRMHRNDGSSHSFIQLPYKGDKIYMLIALPYGRQDPPTLPMSDRFLCRILDQMTRRRVDTLKIPKFRIESSSLLKKPLRDVGITDVFGGSADLSRMRTQRDLYVSSVLHKAVLEVNEQGSEAAATTIVGLTPLMLRNKTEFIADHPFSFYIIHKDSGLVLFHGKVLDLADVTGKGPQAPMELVQAESSKVKSSVKAMGSSRPHGSVVYGDDDEEKR